MYRSDHLLRRIQQFSAALSEVLLRARSDDREVHFEELDELGKSYSGLDLGTLAELDADQIATLFSITGALDVERAYVTAVLLHRLARTDAGHADLDLDVLDLLIRVHDAIGGYIDEEHEALVRDLRSEAVAGAPRAP